MNPWPRFHSFVVVVKFDVQPEELWYDMPTVEDRGCGRDLVLQGCLNMNMMAFDP